MKFSGKPPTISSLLLSLAITCTIIFGCVEKDHHRVQLNITGSSTVAPLVNEMAKKFEQENPGVRVNVQTGGSSRGIQDALKGLADIGMTSRALKEDERNLREFSIAQDGIGLIVHEDNPMAALSSEQIVAIYRKQLTQWPHVLQASEAESEAVSSRPITVVHKAEGRGTLTAFLSHFKLDALSVRADVIVGDNEQGVKTVLSNPNSIGYVSIGTASYHIDSGAPLKMLAVDGIAPSVDNIKTGRFPLVRSLSLVVPAEVSDWTQKFLDFARSAQVHPIIEAQYFVAPAV